MIVLGLTGSIGMGKSTIAKYFESMGVPTLDADRVVHDLYAGKAAPMIEAVFPGVATEAGVDRAALAKVVLASPENLKRLEAIIHPLVRKAEWEFIDRHQQSGADLCLIEIPLLFETGAHGLFDAVLVASATPEMQRARVLSRHGFSAEKFNAIAARQWPDEMKRQKADYVVDTSVAIEDTYRQIDAILAEVKRRPPLAYQRWAELHQELE
jgi:dephospho-CoA kinase